MSKLTEHELMKRLDNEFPDVDFHYTECATKGVVATVYFYEKKLDEENCFCEGDMRDHFTKAQMSKGEK